MNVSHEVPKAKIYLVRDELANRYGTPLFSQMGPEVIADSYRTSIFNNLERSIPLKDCVLYEVGEFDTVTGEIQQYPKEEFHLVCRLGDFVSEALAAKKLKGEEHA